MEASSPFDPLKSTKPQSSPSDQTSKSGSGSLSYGTPEKPENPLRRPRRCLMSVKQVREAAARLHSSGLNRIRRPKPVDPDWLQFGSGQGEAPTRKLKKKKTESLTDLPDKYVLLCKFFDSLDSSLRLLRLKGNMASLKNISSQIECLTERRFSIAHLAQLKYILPEAIKLKKVLVYDEKTFCMKPDVHVALNISSIKNKREQKNVNKRFNMRSVFRSRLLDFVKAHPEEEVPEGSLPEPFNRSQKNRDISSKAASSSTLPATSASHLSQNFRPRFSKQVSSQSIGGDSQASGPFSCLPVMPIKRKNHVKNKIEAISTIEKTPRKDTSTPGELMTVTPELAHPKRCHMTPNEDLTSSPIKRPACNRALEFDTPVKNAEVKNEVEIYLEDLSSDDDIFEILPKSLVQSIREKETKIREENSREISEAKRRKEMIANLPKLFDVIRYSFQASRHSLITKEELLHKIVINRLDIIDKQEAEEQFLLLKERVPDLISEKLAPSGDLLIGINKISSPELIRARLVEAKQEMAHQRRV